MRDGSSWDNASNDLQAMIDQAALDAAQPDATLDAGQVWVAAGTYTPGGQVVDNDDPPGAGDDSGSDDPNGGGGSDDPSGGKGDEGGGGSGGEGEGEGGNDRPDIGGQPGDGSDDPSEEGGSGDDEGGSGGDPDDPSEGDGGDGDGGGDSGSGEGGDDPGGGDSGDDEGDDDPSDDDGWHWWWPWPRPWSVNPQDPRDATFVLTGGVSLYGGFFGRETTLEERDLLRNKTILSGDLGTKGDTSDNAYHVLLAIGNLDGTVLDGLTLTDGNANGVGSLTINGQQIARDSGGGIVLSGSGEVQLRNLSVSGNQASGGPDDLLASPGVSAQQENCLIGDNRSTSGGDTPDNTPGSDTPSENVDANENPRADESSLMGKGDTGNLPADNDDAAQPPAAVLGPTVSPQSGTLTTNEIQVLPDSAIPLTTPLATTPLTNAGEIFGLPVPLMATAFADGWAPVNFVLVAGNIAVMLALLYLALTRDNLAGSRSSTGSTNSSFRRCRAACAVSVTITLLALAAVVATQNTSLPIKPLDAASLGLLLLTFANILLLLTVARSTVSSSAPPTTRLGKLLSAGVDLSHNWPDTNRYDSRNARNGHPPSSLRPRERKGTWLTEDDDSER
jgi:hypothetical protein